MSTSTLIPEPTQNPVAGTVARKPLKSSARAFSWSQLIQALPGALRKLNPAALWHNPVMFLVWVGAALTTVIAIAEPFLGGPEQSGGTAVPFGFTWSIAAWLWWVGSC